MQGDKIPPTPDNELPPIEGELTDEDLKQVSGGVSVGIGNNFIGVVPPHLPIPYGQNKTLFT
jgi:bacteriocin-like protein